MSKTFLCLGAGLGIGLSTTARFAMENFNVILVSRNAERQKNLAEIFKAQTGKTAKIFVSDVSEAHQLKQLAAELPDIDVVHFNAAIIHSQTLEDADYVNLNNDIQVGITGALFALKTFAPPMLQRHSGAFLLTGGMLANNPLSQYLTLGVAKAGIKNMTQALFNVFKEKNVHIATVTVSASIAPKSQESNEVAELFWNLYRQPVNEWTWEEEYKTIQ